MKSSRILGVSLGDPNGIGPEIAIRVGLGPLPAGVRLVLIGARGVADRECARLGLAPLPSADPMSASPSRPQPRLSLWDPAPRLQPREALGRVRKDAALAAAAWIEAGIRGCLAGALDGLVTAPINKEGFLLAGLPYPGHTELLAAHSASPRFGMMLLGGPLRVMLATRHLPLRRVPDALTPDVVGEAIELAGEGLNWLGIDQPRIAVCGLNPHAGDGGALGHEEAETIAPAVARVRRRHRGWRVEGPLSADTVFHFAARGGYDAVVAMYHDQGLAPLKTLAFDRGVNLTLGLPFVRTSPDHGTAYGLAGTGKASTRSMREAIRLAAFLAGRCPPWLGGAGARS